ncbi:MAG: chromosomal replication initiator protein DnaA, partial [Clostridia bacterium]|nr:chromosomal replication initiator protein DnaA [Clostridia bacterium]
MTCPEEIKQMWEIVKESFKGTMSSAAFDMWYGGITPAEYVPETNTLVFETKSEFICKGLSAQHKPILENAFLTQAGMQLNVGFRFVGTVVAAEDILDRIGAIPKPEAKIAFTGDSYQLSKYTFDNFIVGSSNHFARSICWSVACGASSVDEYNPLFIYGPSGVGKTHLMCATINKLRAENPELRVIYTKGDDFLNDMYAHLSRNNMEAFRNRYRTADILVIDDIQFIADKESTQIEIFHTFQSLFDEGKRIILASDRPPKDINPLNERLRSRFEGGLMADVGLPNLELRVAIIKKKADDLAVDIPTEVLTFLAENLRSNIRQIEGAIKKLGALSFLSGREVTMDVVKVCISELLGGAEPVNVTVDKIFNA